MLLAVQWSLTGDNAESVLVEKSRWSGLRKNGKRKHGEKAGNTGLMNDHRTQTFITVDVSWYLNLVPYMPWYRLNFTCGRIQVVICLRRRSARKRGSNKEARDQSPGGHIERINQDGELP